MAASRFRAPWPLSDRAIQPVHAPHHRRPLHVLIRCTARGSPRRGKGPGSQHVCRMVTCLRPPGSAGRADDTRPACARLRLCHPAGLSSPSCPGNSATSRAGPGRALTQCGRPWQARRAPARAPEFALARPGRIRLPPRNQKRTLEPARICRQSRDKAQPGHSRSIDQSMDGSTEGTRGVVPSRVLPLAGGDGFQEPHGIQAHRAQLSGTAAQVRGPSW